MEKEITEEIKNRLLKKWRSNLTKYSKIRDNNFIRITVRGNKIINTDCSVNKDFYISEIKKAEKIISKLV